MADTKISADPVATITGTELVPVVQSGANKTTTPNAIAALATAQGALARTNNLSDVASVTTARTNLGLGSAATQASSAFVQTANNLSDVASVTTARTNLAAAASGANADITSLSGLTTALSIAQGGTAATSAAAARTSLGVAASGSNSDITQLSGLTTALSIAQGGTGSTSASAARNNLGVDGRTTFSNANYTAVSTDKYISQIGTLSASRTLTLPAANSVNAGYVLRIADESGTVTSTNSIVVSRAGSDTINGATSYTITTPYAQIEFISDGSSKWSYGVQGIARGGTGATTAAAALSNLGVFTQLMTIAQGLKSQNFERGLTATGSVMVSQKLECGLVILLAGDTISNALVYCSANAVGLTLTKAGLFSTSGTLLASSADVSSSFTAAANTTVSIAFSTPYVVPTTGAYYVGLLPIGTTPPGLYRQQNAAGMTGLGSGVAPFVSQASQSDIPSPATFVTNTRAYWFGVN